MFTVASFSLKSIEMCSLMSQKTVIMTLFTDRFAWNFFFTGESMSLHSMDLSCSEKPMFISFVNFYLKLSVYDEHYSIKSTWFALLSIQKFHH